jgi:hypothetical protein
MELIEICSYQQNGRDRLGQLRSGQADCMVAAAAVVR